MYVIASVDRNRELTVQKRTGLFGSDGINESIPSRSKCLVAWEGLFIGIFCVFFQRKYQVERYVRQKEKRRNYGVLDLIRTPNLRRKTLIITFIWWVDKVSVQETQLLTMENL
jgi:hypothetical protein